MIGSLRSIRRGCYSSARILGDIIALFTLRPMRLVNKLLGRLVGKVWR